jgi:hypothetical protein
MEEVVAGTGVLVEDLDLEDVIIGEKVEEEVVAEAIMVDMVVEVVMVEAMEAAVVRGIRDPSWPYIAVGKFLVASSTGP